MNLFKRFSLVALLLMPAPLAVAEEPIHRFSLQPDILQPVTIGMDNITTIQFPGPITAVHAARTSMQPQLPNYFVVSLDEKTPSLIALRALQKGAKDNLNVVCDGQVYVIQCVESALPMLHVAFVAPAKAGQGSAPLSSTPNRLLRIHDLAKEFPILKAQHPSLVSGVEALEPRQEFSFPDCSLTILQVLRFPEDDTLAFRCLLRNKQVVPLRYTPDSFGVKVGERLFKQSLSNASGAVPKLETEEVLFLITGQGLSVKNHFIPLFTRIRSAPAPQKLSTK